MTRLLLLALVLSGNALAQFSYRGEVGFSTDATLSEAFPAQVGWSLGGRLAADYDLAPFTLRAVLEPSVRFSQGVSFEPGVIEAYALTQALTTQGLTTQGLTAQGEVDISVGVERLPLETARLSVPYGVEPTGPGGLRRGVPGARLTYYQGGWRLRGAVLHHAGTGSLAPLVSVRRGFGSFDLEAHALYADTLVAGVGGSGLVGDLVLYGEAWLLTGPLEVRGALGLTGNLDRGMWTLEAAYLSPGNASARGQAERDLAAQQALVGPRPVINGQLALPLGEQGDHSLTFTAGALFDPDAARARVGIGYSVLGDDRAFTVNAGGLFGPEPATLTLGLSVRQFF